jgi:hypothetical protein
MKDVIHSIKVPAKYARHARHYVEAYMRGYIRAADAHEARPKAASSRRFLEGPKKASHAEAAYRQHGTAARHCAACSMYQGIDKCTKVVAPISPQATCKFFQKKPESRLARRLRTGGVD